MQNLGHFIVCPCALLEYVMLKNCHFGDKNNFEKRELTVCATIGGEVVSALPFHL
jgi:hypothetical protein